MSWLDIPSHTSVIFLWVGWWFDSLPRMASLVSLVVGSLVNLWGLYMISHLLAAYPKLHYIMFTALNCHPLHRIVVLLDPQKAILFEN